VPQVHEAHSILAKSTFPCRLGQLLLPESSVSRPAAAHGEYNGAKCGCERTQWLERREHDYIDASPGATRDGKTG